MKADAREIGRPCFEEEPGPYWERDEGGETPERETDYGESEEEEASSEDEDNLHMYQMRGTSVVGRCGLISVLTRELERRPGFKQLKHVIEQSVSNRALRLSKNTTCATTAWCRCCGWLAPIPPRRTS